MTITKEIWSLKANKLDGVTVLTDLKTTKAKEVFGIYVELANSQFSLVNDHTYKVTIEAL